MPTLQNTSPVTDPLYLHVSLGYALLGARLRMLHQQLQLNEKCYIHLRTEGENILVEIENSTTFLGSLMKCMQAKLQNDEKDNNNITKMLQLEYLQHFAFNKILSKLGYIHWHFKRGVLFFF